MNFDLALKEIYRQRMMALSKENFRLRQMLSLAAANGGRLEEEDLEWVKKETGEVEASSPVEINLTYD